MTVAGDEDRTTIDLQVWRLVHPTRQSGDLDEGR